MIDDDTVDVADFNPWIPTSLAVDTADGSIYAALGFNERLVTMNYCGGGTPTAMPAAHKKIYVVDTADGATDPRPPIPASNRSSATLRAGVLLPDRASGGRLWPRRELPRPQPPRDRGHGGLRQGGAA